MGYLNDLHYKYINPIRKSNGELRTWEEYNKIVTLENSLDNTQCVYTITQEKNLQVEKHRLVDEERSGI